jgi:hypothetical protein
MVWSLVDLLILILLDLINLLNWISFLYKYARLIFLIDWFCILVIIIFISNS